MAGVFFEGKTVPTDVRRSLNGFGHFGDDDGHMNTGEAVADIFRSITGVAAGPVNFFTDLFVHKPEADAAAQVAAAGQQAQLLAIQDQDKSQTLRIALIAGAGLVGLLAFVLVLKKRSAPAKVAGYRRRRRRR